MLGNNSNVSSMRSRACTHQNEGETQVLKNAKFGLFGASSLARKVELCCGYTVQL